MDSKPIYLIITLALHVMISYPSTVSARGFHSFMRVFGLFVLMFGPKRSVFDKLDSSRRGLNDSDDRPDLTDQPHRLEEKRELGSCSSQAVPPEKSSRYEPNPLPKAAFGRRSAASEARREPAPRQGLGDQADGVPSAHPRNTTGKKRKTPRSEISSGSEQATQPQVYGQRRMELPQTPEVLPTLPEVSFDQNSNQSAHREFEDEQYTAQPRHPYSRDRSRQPTVEDAEECAEVSHEGGILHTSSPVADTHETEISDNESILEMSEAVEDELLYQAIAEIIGEEEEEEQQHAHAQAETRENKKPERIDNENRSRTQSPVVPTEVARDILNTGWISEVDKDADEAVQRRPFRASTDDDLLPRRGSSVPSSQPPSSPAGSGTSPRRSLPSELSEDSDEEINYMDPRGSCSKKDFATISHHDVRIRSKISRDADICLRLFQRAVGKRRAKIQEIQEKRALQKGRQYGIDETQLKDILKIARAGGEDLFVAEVRTARSIVDRITGVRVIQVDRCANNCLAYRMNETVTTLSCSQCGAQRYKPIMNATDQLEPVATFPYIPIEPRLKLWFSEPAFVKMMTEYRRLAERCGEEKPATLDSEKDQPTTDRRYIDIFSADYFQNLLKKTEYFGDPHKRDLAFFASLDEFGPFQKRPWFKITPILLSCYNIPPEIRYKDRYLLVVGFIPGRTESEMQTFKQLRSSFLRPFTDEMKKLSKGVKAWDSLDGSYFKLRANLCVVGTDMAERFKLLGTLGYNAKMFCEYCKQVGLWGDTHIYCPDRAPIDTPARAFAKEEKARLDGSSWFDFSPEADTVRIEGSEERTVAHFEWCLQHFRLHGYDKEFATRVGISGECILNEIPTISLPWSFPPDLLHLIKGVAEILMDHYNGTMFKKSTNPNPTATAPANNATADEQQAEEEREEPNDHVIASADWRDIGRYIDKSRATIPLSIGEVANIEKYAASMKADAWFSWVLQLSPVYLSKFLPKEHMDGYLCFVKAAQLCAYGRSLTKTEIERVDSLIREFLEYYELKLYRRKWKRLSACRALIHQLKHVSTFMAVLGPMGGYSQFPIERFIGATDSQIRNRSDTNKHLELVIHSRQQLHLLPFVLPLTEALAHTFMDKVAGDSFFDPHGNLRVTKLFAAAVELDARAQQAEIDSDSDCQERPTDKEPWFEPDYRLQKKLEGHPRLPLAGIEEDSDLSDYDEEGVLLSRKKEHVIDINMVLSRPVKDVLTGRELKQTHQTIIMRALARWGWIPKQEWEENSLASLKSAVLKNGFRQWRTLFVGKRRMDITNPMAFSMFEVTGAEKQHWFRKRSAACVEYNPQSMAGAAEITRFGKVLYFISLTKRKHPEGDKDGDTEQSATDDDQEPANFEDPIQLAVVERFKVERCDYLLRIPRKSKPILEVIRTKWIKEPIGLVQWIDGSYVTWHDGCIYEGVGELA